MNHRLTLEGLRSSFSIETNSLDQSVGQFSNSPPPRPPPPGLLNDLKMFKKWVPAGSSAARSEILEIPVIPLTALRQEAPVTVRRFSRLDRYAFSAITVFDGTARVIVHNDSHSPGRQASNLAHELSHGLLLHSPRPALDGRGCRDWDQEEEHEANWFAGALLVPDEAAILIARRGLSVPEAAEVYGVSEQMMTFRLNVTAAVIRVQRAKQFRW